MYFGTFLDRDGNYIDTVHFPPAARKYPFRGRGVYKLIGKVMEEFDSISIEIDSMEKLGVIQDPRYTEYEPKQLKS
jgi:DNA polymerase-3 subunit alpha